MPTLNEVKAQIGAEKNKVFSSVNAIIGSPFALAVLLAAAIAFGSHLVWAPTRLAPLFDNFSALTLGLPPVDFGMAGQGAAEAGAAAIRQGAPDIAAETLAQHAWVIPSLNALGFGAALILLVWNISVTLRRKRAALALNDPKAWHKA